MNEDNNTTDFSWEETPANERGALGRYPRFVDGDMSQEAARKMLEGLKRGHEAAMIALDAQNEAGDISWEAYSLLADALWGVYLEARNELERIASRDWDF